MDYALVMIKVVVFLSACACVHLCVGLEVNLGYHPLGCWPTVHLDPLEPLICPADSTRLASQRSFRAYGLGAGISSTHRHAPLFMTSGDSTCG